MTDDETRIAHMLDAIRSPERVRILTLIHQSDGMLSQYKLIERYLQTYWKAGSEELMAQSTFSYHLSHLYRAGLVTYERHKTSSGSEHYYSIRHEAFVQLRAFLDALALPKESEVSAL